MYGISFNQAVPRSPSDPNRMDVACFVGLVRRRTNPAIPAHLREWWERNGWYARMADNGLDLPVPLESWQEFAALFATTRAAVGSDASVECYLANVVRQFFAQGGRRCYVVCMGDPLPVRSTTAQKIPVLGQLLFGDYQLWNGLAGWDSWQDSYFPSFSTGTETRNDWHGVDHLLGLPDVAMLSFPDLSDLLGADAAVWVPLLAPATTEIFAECAPTTVAPAEQTWSLGSAPRCDEDAYAAWVRVVGALTRFVREAARELQLVASLPLPQEDVRRDFTDRVLGSLLAQDAGAASAFVQVVYPWLRATPVSRVPGGIDPPEGFLVGMLAVQALARGAAFTIAGKFPAGAVDLEPKPPQAWMGDGTLSERVSLFVQTVRGVQLFSDVTTSTDVVYRPASVNRLMAQVVRSARNYGVSATFEPLSAATWRALERSLAAFLNSLYSTGALRGRSADDAYTVRCDRSTMTQNDIDQGRLVAAVSFQPSLPVERIQIDLAVDESGAMLTGAVL